MNTIVLRLVRVKVAEGAVYNFYDMVSAVFMLLRHREDAGPINTTFVHQSNKMRSDFLSMLIFH